MIDLSIFLLTYLFSNMQNSMWERYQPIWVGYITIHERLHLELYEVS